MPDPIDPDTEDRRPDRDRDRDREDELRDAYEDDDQLDDEVVSNQLDLFDEDSDLIDLDYDDLRDMEGPDA